MGQHLRQDDATIFATQLDTTNGHHPRPDVRSCNMANIDIVETNQGAECLQKEAVVEWQERTACHLKAQIRFRAQRELDRRADNKRWAGAKLEDYLDPTARMMQSDAPENPAQASRRPTWRCPYGHTYCHVIDSLQEFLCCARCINMSLIHI